MNFFIRRIEKKDNKAVENLIRSCLVEFGANHKGTAWEDKNLARFSEVYNEEKSAYWVAVDNSEKIIGGAGIGKLLGVDDICELQKMYCFKEARGKGIAQSLLITALDFARGYYKECYLETLSNMKAAQKFYEKNGFKKIASPVGNTGHYACDVLYIKKL